MDMLESPSFMYTYIIWNSGKKVGCTLLFSLLFQNSGNIFHWDVTKISILKAVDQPRLTYSRMFNCPAVILCTIIEILKVHFENSTPTISVNSNNQLVFVMFKDSILCEAEAEYLCTYVNKMNGRLQSVTHIKPRRHFWRYGYAISQLVDALRYKPEDSGFDSWWGNWGFSLI
jgi:hypothetical protein